MSGIVLAEGLSTEVTAFLHGYGAGVEGIVRVAQAYDLDTAQDAIVCAMRIEAKERFGVTREEWDRFVAEYDSEDHTKADKALQDKAFAHVEKDIKDHKEINEQLKKLFEGLAGAVSDGESESRETEDAEPEPVGAKPGAGDSW